MKRKKDIVIVCHCVINCNSKVEGLSLFEGALDFIKVLIEVGSEPCRFVSQGGDCLICLPRTAGPDC